MVRKCRSTTISVITMATLLSAGGTALGGFGVQFGEVTASAGISYIGKTWGVSWGDFDGDGWPDVWVSNHQWHPSLYLNKRDGTFEEISDQVWAGDPYADSHGSAWADFDNDGDEDLLELVGGGAGQGSDSNHLLVNTGTRFDDQADILGLTYPKGRGRTPLWLDYDRDGLLDVFLTGEKRADAPPTIFRQTRSGLFEDMYSQLGLDLAEEGVLYAQMSDLFGTGSLILLARWNRFPTKIYNTDSIPFLLLDNSIIPKIVYYAGGDSIIADFNGDILPDIYLTRFKWVSGFGQDHEGKVDLHVATKPGLEKGISFSAIGDSITFRLYTGPHRFTDQDIYIGTNGSHPAQFECTRLLPNFEYVFSVDTGNVANHGIAAHNPGVDKGVYIGFDSERMLWEVLVSYPGSRITNVVIEALAIAGVTPIGFDPDEPNLVDAYFVNTGDGFMEAGAAAGLAGITSARAAVAGDFDNDMDLDIYLVCAGAPENRANILYENQGEGTFVAVPDAAGARGSTIGYGDSVGVADYDLDGFLDLFVTNGKYIEPFSNGPHQLFRNMGNENHWIQIDLEGVVSNRNGLGSRIILSAGGVTQLREQDGGMHKFSQNFKRIHFGLGGNRKADRIVIRWPSGILQDFRNVPGDQVVRIVEPSFPSVAGNPNYTIGVDQGVFLWKDRFEGPYHLRIVGNGVYTKYQVKVASSIPLGSVVPHSFEAHDNLVRRESGFVLQANVSTGEDGVDFYLDDGAVALIAVEQNGIANPRQIHIGRTATHPSPQGWVLKLREIPTVEASTSGRTWGFSVGKDASGDSFQLRYTADDNDHEYEMTVLSSRPIKGAAGVTVEATDIVEVSTHLAQLRGRARNWWYDGLDVQLSGQTEVGLILMQDGLFQAHRLMTNLGTPNAYVIPGPGINANGEPIIDSSAESGLFFWKDPNAQTWHARLAAGGGYLRVRGNIFCNKGIGRVNEISIEPDDQLDVLGNNRLEFDIGARDKWTDGFDFSCPTSDAIVLDLETHTAETIHLGASKESPQRLPIDLGYWSSLHNPRAMPWISLLLLED